MHGEKIVEERTTTPFFSRSQTLLLMGAIAVFALDRIAKYLSLTMWSARPVTPLPGIHLTFLLNPGIALSIPLHGFFTLAVVLLLLCGLLVWVVRTFRSGQFLRTVFLLVILLGAASNLLDRLLYGGVVDYLQIVLPTVINLADVMVVAGIILLLVVPRDRNNEVSAT